MRKDPKGGTPTLIGVFNCPECGVEQKFAGRCDPCSKKRRAARAAEAKPRLRENPVIAEAREAIAKNPPKYPSNRARTRARVKRRSDRRVVEQAALNALKLILGPFVKKCLRCENPNPAGTGFKSGQNPAGLEAHHPFRRRGYFFFIVVPVCESCHKWIHDNPVESKEERFLQPTPKKASQ